MTNKKIYGSIEPNTISQFYDAISNKFVIDSALMPDAHYGYSLPIGGVVLTENVIVPEWVGNDIGCGVYACKLSIKKQDIENYRNEIFNEIYKKIPTTSKHNSIKLSSAVSKVFNNLMSKYTYESKTIFDSTNGARQIGTLGKGNHFIEIGFDEKDFIWLVVHSGSREFGSKIAENYMKKAQSKGNNCNYIDVLENPKLADDYYNDQLVTSGLAKLNRITMVELVIDIIKTVLNVNTISQQTSCGTPHNFVEKIDFNKFLHRKGASSAKSNILSVIPGSMKHGSYIVMGKGNPDFLYSSSHGAGRVLSRRKAREELKLEEFESMMANITAKIDTATLDEAPLAYKNIVEVLKLQDESISIMHHIKPLINIKG